jgi:hypothetical protein
MSKVLCIAGIVVAGLLLLVFLLDLAVALPFGRASLLVDIGLALSAAILGYLGWATLKQL